MPRGWGYAKTMGWFRDGLGYDLKLLLNLAPDIPQNEKWSQESDLLFFFVQD